MVPFAFRETGAFLDDHNGAIVAIFTFFLAVSTIGLWVVTWQSGERQSAETKILQRAYIAVEPRGIVLLVEGDRVIGHVGIKNAGNLPAKDVAWFVGIKKSDSGEEKIFPLDDAKGSIVVSPHSETVRGSEKYVSIQDLPSAGERKDQARAYLYVWGTVNYHDGFVSGRTTTFCHRYNWINRGRDGAGWYEVSAQYARDHESGNGAT